MEEERDRMEAVFQELNQTLEVKSNELASAVTQLEGTKKELASTSHKLVKTKQACEEQQVLVSAHCSTEVALSSQARELLVTADVATKHVACLHDTVDKRKTVESTNLQITRTYREESEEQRGTISTGVRNFADTVNSAFSNLQSALDAYTTSSTQTQEQNKQQLENLVQTFTDTMNEIKSATSESHTTLVQSSASHRSQLQSSVTSHCAAVQATLAAFLHSFVTSLQHAQGVDVRGNVAAFVQQWYSGAAARVSSLQRAHAAYSVRAAGSQRQRAAAECRQRDARRAHMQRRASKAQACLAEMEEESARLEQLLTQQLSDIETERQLTENRLQEWMEEKRRLLEEELARHVATEKQALEDRLAKKVTEIETHKKMLGERMERYKEWQDIQAEADREEMEMAEGDLEEWQSEREECAKDVKKYGKEFEEGANAINVDMEIFSKNVVEVVEHINNEMLRVLELTRVQVEQEVSNVISRDEETCQQFVTEADNTLTNIVDSTKQITDALVSKIEANSSSAVSQLSRLSTSTASLIVAARTQQAAHAGACARAQHDVERAQAQLREALARHAELEGRYLSEEYKVYSPTGKTPSRMEYRYPRMLAATSPHDRLLARFRAMRQSHDDDCIVVESDPEPPAASDSESSASEDSAIFAAPSPPLASAPRHAKSIVKSTSETDILYTMKKQQENAKENANRSITSKKPSKLPAPSSHKKPLVERNAN